MFDTTQSKEMFGQATRAFEAAIQSGIKLQEESVKFLTEMFSEMSSPEKWQKTTQAMINGMVDSSRKSMEEAVQVMNENAKTSLELLQQAFHSPPTDAEEAQARATSLWEAACGPCGGIPRPFADQFTAGGCLDGDGREVQRRTTWSG